MARDDYEENERESGGGRKSSSRSRGGRGGSGDVWGAVASGLSTSAIIDIVERLGLVDMIVDRLKQRLEDIDVDELIDEIADYLKRNPEVLVVSLGAVTIAAGALVYLNRRREGGSTSTTSTKSGGSKKRNE